MTIKFDSWERLGKIPGASAIIALDSDPNMGVEEKAVAQARARMAMNEKTFGAMLQRHTLLDSGEVSQQARFLARQLEYIFTRVKETEFAPENLFSAYSKETSVPDGATQFTHRRMTHTGSADYYEPGSARKPTSNFGVAEKQYDVLPIVTSSTYSLFDKQAGQFSGVQVEANLRQAMRKAIMQFVNREGWYGTRLPSVLDYPFLDTTITPIVMGPGTGASNLAIVQEFHRLINGIYERSNQVYKPNEIHTSVRMERWLKTTKIVGSIANQTIAQAIVEDSPDIGSLDDIKGFHELRGRGPGGRDAMLFVNTDRDSISLNIPRDFTPLPVQDNGMEFSLDAYLMWGGVVMLDKGNNKLVWAEYKAS